jgi:uncharacterized protein YndB with AHSA1/START domain
MSEHELSIELILDAPKEKLYRCYTDPALLKQWFAPKPWTILSVDTDVRPGGRFNFVMASPEGQEYPNTGLFLAVEPNKRLVTTDAVKPDSFEPAGPFMVADVTFEDAGGGKTKYRAVARHWSAEAKEQHAQMGFVEGWTQTARQLEELAKTL